MSTQIGGELLRNEFGSPTAQTGATAAKSPDGDGALILSTSSGSEKADYGTETELAGLKIGSLTELSFRAYVTDGDVSFGSAYQPNIQIEVNPKGASGTTATYSSLVYVPPAAALTANAWSEAIDALTAGGGNGTDGWYFSNAATAAATNCSQAHFCTYAELRGGGSGSRSQLLVRTRQGAVTSNSKERWTTSVWTAPNTTSRSSGVVKK